MAKEMRGLNFKSLFLTGCSRTFAALGGLIFTAAVGRLLGAEALGLFVFANSIILLLVMAARFGGDRDLIKFASIHREIQWSQERVTRLAKAYLISSAIAAIAVISLLLISLVAETSPRGKMLAMLAPAILLMSWMWLNAGFLKGMSYPHIGTLFENGGVLAISTAILLLAALTFELELSVLVKSYIAAGAIAWAASFAAVLLVNRRPTGEEENKPRQSAIHERSNFSYTMIDMTNFLMASGSFIIGGSVLADHDIGLLRGAERVSLLVAFVMSVTNVIVAPRLARSFADGNHDQLVSASQWAVKWNAILAMPIFLICMLYPTIFVRLLGPEFAGIEPLIQIMAAGQLVNGLVGPGALILVMTDHAKLAARINVISLTFSAILYLLLSSFFGIVGFAMAFFLSILFKNALMLAAVKKKLQIWYLPYIKI